jgi:hypothetical protein
MQRFGKNQGGYHGETIDITAVLKDCLAPAQKHGWNIEEIHAGPDRDLLAFNRLSSRFTEQSSRIYISTGIHGDEPAGPLTIRRLLQ